MIPETKVTPERVSKVTLVQREPRAIPATKEIPAFRATKEIPAFRESRAGDQGDTGAGIQGDTGTTGAKGDTGDQGDTGAGVQGDTGTAGAKGDTGDQGDTGAGIQGDTGADSTVKGDTGDDGDTGTTYTWEGAWVTSTSCAYICISAHTSGDTDDEPGTGATWTTYWDRYVSQGDTGTSGAQGDTGANGATGVDGDTGVAASYLYSITVESPTASEDISMGFTFVAITEAEVLQIFFLALLQLPILQLDKI
jgi:hypothetical protein